MPEKQTTTNAYSRRHLLSRALIAACGLPAALGALACAAEPSRSRSSGNPLLICLFLRGGVDGLSVAAPYAEDDYYRLRPTIALASPSDRRAAAPDRLVRLTDHFGLHPALAPLKPLYDAGELAIIPACGSSDPTHSHFEAMAAMERGLRADADPGPASGWLARYLDAAPPSTSPPSPARAIAVGDTLPQSLQGAGGVPVIQRVGDLSLKLPFQSHNVEIAAALSSLYAPSPSAPPAQRSGADTLRLLRAVSDIAAQPGPSARYPAGDLGDGLRQVAMLARANIGLEVACLNHVGYDTHVAQGGAQGQLAGLLQELAGSLAALRDDLGASLWRRTTVIVQSEFGRRVEENSGMGTDHGSGGLFMALGGQVRGGRLYGEWPTLASNQLDGPGDLRVTTDYRNVLAEALAACGGSDLPATRVFPTLNYRPLGLFHNA